MFTALAENYGDLRSKINLFVALAPVVRIDNAYNDMDTSLAESIDRAQYWLASLGIDEIFGPGW